MELQLSSPSCPCLPGSPSRNSSQFSEHLGFLLISFSQHHQQSLALKRGRGEGKPKAALFLKKKESLCIRRTLSCKGRLHSPAPITPPSRNNTIYTWLDLWPPSLPPCLGEKGHSFEKNKYQGLMCVLNFKMLNDGEKYFGKETIFQIVLHSKVNRGHMASTKT